MINLKSIKATRKLLKTVFSVFFTLLVLLLVLSAGLQANFARRIYPNTLIGNIDVSGLTIAETEQLLQERWAKLANHGFVFQVGNEQATILPFVTAPGNPDQAYELVTWDIEADIKHALSFAHEPTIFRRIINSLLSLVTVRHYPAQVQPDTARLEDILQQNFSHLERPAANARLTYQNNRLITTPAAIGTTLDYASGINQLSHNLIKLESSVINLQLVQDRPTITAHDVDPLLSEARTLLSRAPFTLSTTISEHGRSIEHLWTLTPEMVRQSLTAQRFNNEIRLAFNASTTQLLLSIAEDINREALDAKFEISEAGKIGQFQGARSGLELDLEASLELLRQNIIINQRPTSTLVVNILEPQIKTADVNNLGITEILGVGKSNFSGSPRNRRTNIQVSSDKLNGLLIAPDEEFSLVESLKPFTAAAGYVPELVIKGSRLIPEIGGGACQIGTTTFRAALDAGLEITQRRNHSFAVRYYNDENGLPGMDATIYDPAPDFRFRNNTDHHILIQTHIDDETDDLIYEFWGTADGRQASTTIPVILSRLAAPETKYIETTDLEPGVTECSGSNVPGYHTSFTYGVETTNGEYAQETFKSKYRPFQRVCLVGVEKNSEVIEELEE